MTAPPGCHPDVGLPDDLKAGDRLLAHPLGRQQTRTSRLSEFRRDLSVECRNRLRNSYLCGDITEAQYISRAERVGWMTTGGLCELVIELRAHDRQLYRRLSKEPSTWRI